MHAHATFNGTIYTYSTVLKYIATYVASYICQNS